MKNILAIIIAAVLALVALYFGGKYFTTNFSQNSEPVYNNTGNFNSQDITYNYERVDENDSVPESHGDSGIAQEVTPELMHIPIPLFGENSVVFKDYLVPQSTAVLDAGYTKLFSLGSNPTESEFVRNYVDDSGLDFDSVSLSNGVARLNLDGQYRGMHFGNFGFRQQINALAFQYSTVNSIEVYLNGNRFDWCIASEADESESGCDTTPKYWIDAK